MLAAAGCLGLLAGCGPSVVSHDAQLLASVGETAIRVADLQAELERRAARGQRPAARQVLEELIRQEALVARARQLGLEGDPDVIRAHKNQLIVELKKRELEPALQAVEAFSNPDFPASRQNEPPARMPQIRLAILRQEVHAKTPESKRRQLEARLEAARSQAAELPAGERGFGSLAIEFSDDQATRYQGGDLGWLAEDASRLNLDAAVFAAAARLQAAGEISPVIRGRDGLYVARLLGRRAADPVSNKTAAAVAQHRRWIEERKRIEADFEQKARAGVPIVVKEENFNQLRDFAARPEPGAGAAEF